MLTKVTCPTKRLNSLKMKIDKIKLSNFEKCIAEDISAKLDESNILAKKLEDLHNSNELSRHQFQLR